MSSYLKSFIPSLIVFLVGYLIDNPGLIFLSAALYGILLIYQEVRVSHSELNPILLFSISMCITSVANYIGVQAFDADNEYVYNLYADKPSILDASLIHYIGMVSLITGFQIGNKVNLLPQLSYQIDDEKGDKNLFILNSILMVYFIFRNIPGFLGAIRSFLVNLPLFTSFYFVKKSIKNDIPRLFIYGIFFVVILTINSVLYSYLRSEMIKPAIFFIMAYLIGHRNIKVLFRIKLIPVYVFGVIFISYFGIFGSERSRIGAGTQRLEDLMELKEGETIEGQTPLARATNFNQLSQVVRITREEGFLNGETLEYMTYVFIPRFIWPEKPLIQIGAWFAEKIGLGWLDYEGRYHNSINMTIPGELFINFGYTGVILGSIFIGLLFRIFWNSVRNWKDPGDLFANLFAAYLLYLGFFTLGADIQIMVTILAIYLIMLFLNKFIFRNA